MRRVIHNRQPRYPAPIDRSNPINRNLRRCFSAVHGILDPSTGLPWPTAFFVTGSRVMGRSGTYMLDTSNGNYVSTLQALPAGGWTIAMVYLPINGTAADVIGFCELPGSGTGDRAINTNGGGATAFKAYLNDGGVKTSGGVGTLTGNISNRVLARCTPAFSLQACVNGIFDTAVTCTNNGYTGYTSPEFCVGNASNVSVASQGFALACYWDRALTNGEIESWCANPWQMFLPWGQILYLGQISGTPPLVAAQGSYALSGQTTAFNTSQTSGQGAYALTGQPANFAVTANVTMPAAQGAYALTGQDAAFSLTASATMAAAQGAYALTGQSAQLTTTGNYSMAAAQGSYALSGQAATFSTNLALGGAQGTYALTGQAASFATGATLTAGQGAYALSGQPATFNFTASATMAADQGAYALTGQPATFAGLTTMAAAQGSYALSGTDVQFTVGARMSAAQGSYLLSGQDAWTVVDRYQLNTLLEGNSVVDLGFGQPGERYATLSFWVNSAKTGKYCVALRNGPKNRSYVAEYEVKAANTWEYKVISFAVDTSGTWLYDNGLGLLITWSLAGGSARAEPGVWTQGNFTITANQVNLLETVGNTFALNLIQLLPARTAAPYQWQSHQEVIAECEHWRTEFY